MPVRGAPVPLWRTIRAATATTYDPNGILSSVADTTTSGTGVAGVLDNVISATVAGSLDTSEIHAGGTLMIPLTYPDGAPLLIGLNRTFGLHTRLRWDPTEPAFATDSQISLTLATAAVGSSPVLASGAYASYGIKWDSVLGQKRTISDLNGAVPATGSAATPGKRMVAIVLPGPNTVNTSFLVSMTGLPLDSSGSDYILASPGGQNLRTITATLGHQLWLGITFGRARNTAGAVTLKGAVDYVILPSFPGFQ